MNNTISTTRSKSSILYPSYIKLANTEDMAKSLKKTFSFEPEVIERLLTAVPSDAHLTDILKIYHCDTLTRWKNIETWLKKNHWRYTHANNYISMMILGLQHYTDELSAGWWLNEP